MSLPRLVITAVFLEGRPVAEVSRSYGISRSWIYELLARYRAEGDEAFEPRSRRPRSSPNAVNAATVELIVKTRERLDGQGLDAGAETIRWHLEHHHDVKVSTATIWRHLKSAGLIKPEPKKKPKSAYIRFEADQPNECWQSDFTHWSLTELGVTQKNSRPNHPTTCGKVERFHQTLKQWLSQQPPAETIAKLQTQLDDFTDIYNHQRPHRSLPNRATPATAYHARPKASPTTDTPQLHHRVRTDRVDTSGKVTLRHNGKLHHIGIGRTHARTRIILLVAELDIRIINAATGELLRHLTLDPTRNYQPTGKPHSQKRRTPRT